MGALRIGFFGAGAIGGYLGVRLSAAGIPVVLVGRPDLVSARDTLVAIDRGGTGHRPSADLVASSDPAALHDVDVCFVTVKSSDTATAGESLRGVLSREAVVVSLQNGIRNPETLSRILGRSIIAGMVTYNVRREGPERFRRAATGPLMLAKGGEIMARVADSFARAGEPIELRPDMDAILRTKLLLNLNNGLCAITGLSIADSLRARALRRSFAACMTEGIAIMRARKLTLSRIGPLAPPLIARLLPIPDFVFVRLARSMMAIDPAARSSTLQDIDRGKPTEIDYLNGEIVHLATEAGLSAPVNAFVTAEVHRIERAGRPPPFLTATQVWEAITTPRSARDGAPGDETSASVR